jgi:hypothetical protein
MLQAATLRADRRRRRWVAPTRPKPAIIIAQLAGSGTGSEIENESAVPLKMVNSVDRPSADILVVRDTQNMHAISLKKSGNTLRV